jgi:hypothetical protein
MMDPATLTSLASLVGQVGLPIAVLVFFMNGIVGDIKKLLILQAKILTLLCVIARVDERDITE